MKRTDHFKSHEKIVVRDSKGDNHYFIWKLFPPVKWGLLYSYVNDETADEQISKEEIHTIERAREIAIEHVGVGAKLA